LTAEQYGAARVVEDLDVLRQGRLAQVGERRGRERQPCFLAAKTEERMPDQSWLTEHYLWISIDPVLTRIPKAAVTFHGRIIN